MDFVLIRPIIDEHSRLCDIPRDWIVLIEPKITRMGGHWYWGGAIQQGKYPVLYIPGEAKLTPAKRFIAHLFWDFDDRGVWTVNDPGLCREQLCVHPKHLILRKTHPRLYEQPEFA